MVRQRLTLSGRHVIAARLADMQLPRPANAPLRIGHHFQPLADPANRARDREQRREHAVREPIAFSVPGAFSLLRKSVSGVRRVNRTEMVLTVKNRTAL